MVTSDKSEFGQLNDKRYILPDGMSSLQYGHLALSHIESFKESLFPLNPEKIIKYHKYNLLRFEQEISESNERMTILNNVLLQQPVFYKRGSLKRSQFQIPTNTRDFFYSVYGRNFNASVMANPQTESYNGTLSGNILVLGSSGSEKTSLVQKIATDSIFGKLEGVYWVSGIFFGKRENVKLSLALK